MANGGPRKGASATGHHDEVSNLPSVNIIPSSPFQLDIKSS